MLNAFLTIPWFILTFLMPSREMLWLKLLEAGMQAVSAFMFIFAILTLQQLLNQRYAYHDIDRFIGWLIRINVVVTAISILGLASDEIATAVTTVALILIVPLGVIQSMLGFRLLRISDEPGSLFRAYGYLNVATGILLATIIILPLGIFTGAIADIMLGTILFQAASPGQVIDTQV